MSSTSEEADPSEYGAAVRNSAAGPLPSRVTFNRFELNRILNLYGRMVADGEWRDYAIDFLKDRAVFSVFRRASEVPIYRIEKDPRLARKQGIYSVVSASGLILRRGHELDRVLLVIDRKLAVVYRASLHPSCWERSGEASREGFPTVCQRGKHRTTAAG